MIAANVERAEITATPDSLIESFDYDGVDQRAHQQTRGAWRLARRQ